MKFIPPKILEFEKEGCDRQIFYVWHVQDRKGTYIYDVGDSLDLMQVIHIGNIPWLRSAVEIGVNLMVVEAPVIVILIRAHMLPPAV